MNRKHRMTPIVTRVFLVVSGAILLAVGIGVLFQPHAFFASNGATLTGEPSLMSEVRAPGGMLLVSGIVVLVGAVWASVSWYGLALSALVYGTFGIARLVSMAFDGMPSDALVAATGVELVLGLLSLAVLLASGSTAPLRTAVR